MRVNKKSVFIGRKSEAEVVIKRAITEYCKTSCWRYESGNRKNEAVENISFYSLLGQIPTHTHAHRRTHTSRDTDAMTHHCCREIFENTTRWNWRDFLNVTVGRRYRKHMRVINQPVKVLEDALYRCVISWLFISFRPIRGVKNNFKNACVWLVHGLVG